MKRFADENIARALVAQLRARGHDVLYASEAQPRASDTDWLTRAEAEGRLILTSDKDFGDLIFRDGLTRSEVAMAPAFTTGAATVAEPALTPLLRLITNGAAAETRVSGARAGRGKGVELQLPGEPTVSRVHATFTCTGGEWRITVLGRNGVLLNGTALTGEHVVRDGDSIRWGQQSGAPVSAVVIR